MIREERSSPRSLHPIDQHRSITWNVTGFALRLTLTDHVGIPPEGEPDPLSEAEAAFAPPPPKTSKPKGTGKSKETHTLVKAPPKKSAAKKQKAA